MKKKNKKNKVAKNKVNVVKTKKTSRTNKRKNRINKREKMQLEETEEIRELNDIIDGKQEIPEEYRLQFKKEIEEQHERESQEADELLSIIEAKRAEFRNSLRGNTKFEQFCARRDAEEIDEERDKNYRIVVDKLLRENDR